MVLFRAWAQAGGGGPSSPAPACTDPSIVLRAASTPLPAAPPAVPPAAAPPPAPREPAPGYGCGAALEYLRSHAAPGYQLVCPGYAQGREAMTCDDWASICPGQQEIVISDPCPVAYMNEASNSLVFAHLSTAPIDPFGYSCER